MKCRVNKRKLKSILMVSMRKSSIWSAYNKKVIKTLLRSEKIL